MANNFGKPRKKRFSGEIVRSKGNPAAEKTREKLHAAAISWKQKIFKQRPDVIAESSDVNAAANAQALADIYKVYYADGLRQGGAVDLYKLMGSSTSGYLREPAPAEALEELMAGAAKGGYKVSPQNLYSSVKEALDNTKNGGYIKFENTVSPLDESDPAQEGLARRIIVNVTSQRAGLEIVKNLTPLFKNEQISPYFSQVKILLSNNPMEEMPLKHDKIVVYYDLGEATDDAHDEIGDRLVAAIKGAAVQDADFDPHGTVFMSAVSPGIFWAEEPKYHSTNTAMAGSFTQARAKVVAAVVEANEKISGPEEFMKLVQDQLAKSGVDPVNPQRHIKQTEVVPLSPRAPRPINQ
jgi:hypothetical protein